MKGMENGSADVFASSDQKNRCLLIVDSDAQNLLYVSLLLQRFEYQIGTAKTAREAFVNATAALPSLIITSIGLQDMSGLNLMKLLRQNAKTAVIPFIAMRRQEDAVGEQHCFNAGAVACLCKPVSAELLYRAVQGALEERPREAMRIRTIQPVKVDATSPGTNADMHTLDMSERGMFLRTTTQFPANTHLAFRINLNGVIILAEGKVIYTCPQGKGPYQEPGMGLQFTRISPHDLELVRRFIRNEVMRGIVPEQDLSYSSKTQTS